MAKDYYDLDIYSDKKPKKTKNRESNPNKLAKEKKEVRKRSTEDDFDTDQQATKVRKVSKLQIAMTVIIVLSLIAKFADNGNKNTSKSDKLNTTTNIVQPTDRDIIYYFDGGNFTYDGNVFNLDRKVGFLSGESLDSVEFSEFSFNGGYDGLEMMLDTKARTANSLKDAMVTKCDAFDEVDNCGNYIITYCTSKGISTECIFWDNTIQNSLLNKAFIIKIQSNVAVNINKITTDETDTYNEALINVLQSVQFNDTRDGYVEAYP